MPWHCPACQTIINYTRGDEAPRSGERYRCHVCRLELQLDPVMKKLTLAPLDVDTGAESRTRPLSTAAEPAAQPPRKSGD